MNREIYLIDLILYALSKWRSIVLGGIVLALAAGGLFFVVEKKDEEQFQLEQQLEAEAEIELTNLSEEELERAKIKKVQLDGYYTVLKAYSDYAEGSAKMSLNPNKFYTATVNYMVDASNSSYAYMVAEAYKDSLISSAMLEDIAKTLGEDKEEQYYRSVISAEVINISEEESTAKNNQTEGVVLKVSFLHNEEESCEKIIDIIDKWIEKSAAKIQNIEDYKLNRISAAVSECNDTALISGQKGTIENMSAVYNSIINIKNGMSAKEKEYYRKTSKYAYEELKNDESEVLEVKDTSNLVIYVAVGLIGGMAVVAFLHCVYYVLDARIRNKRDLENCTDILCFAATVPEKNQGKGIFAKLDSFISSLRIREDGAVNDLDMLYVFLKTYAEKKQMSELYITGSRIDSGRFPEELNVLISKMKEQGMNVRVGKGTLADSSSIEECKACDAVLLVETCDVSKARNIKETLAKIAYCDIEVVGAVLVR